MNIYRARCAYSRRSVLCTGLLLAALQVQSAAAVESRQAQLSSVTEAQIGNLPVDAPDDLRTVYHQLSFDYTFRDDRTGSARAGFRSESFRASESGRGYEGLAQRFVEFRRGSVEVTVGHFYTILGSGLLLHSFELPGVITQSRGAGRRYQIIRDLDGLQVRASHRLADITILRGTPVNSEIAPGEGVGRRQGTVQGGTLAVRPWEVAEFGLSLVNYDIGPDDLLGAAVSARLQLRPFLSRVDLYGEYAQVEADLSRWFSMARQEPRALYLASSVAGDDWGLSLEYKDYWAFGLLNINNPPTAIREHEAYLLNRQTHELLADDERGVQAELSWALPRNRSLSANLTRTTRRLAPGSRDDMTLHELFLQLDSPLGESLQSQVYVDYSRNRILRNARRWTFGSYWD